MEKDFYTDAILGAWKQDKKKSNKSNLVYVRKATVMVHKDNAMSWTDPEDFKEYKVHGELTLVHTKLFDIATSIISLYKGIEMTNGSIKTLKIK